MSTPLNVVKIQIALPSIRELASSPTIGYDLHIIYIQFLLANLFCLADWYTHTDELKKVWKVCDWLYHLVCGWLWMFQPVTRHTLCRTNNSILQLAWVLIVVGFYQIYSSNIECTIIREVYWSPESTIAQHDTSVWNTEYCKFYTNTCTSKAVCEIGLIN